MIRAAPLLLLALAACQGASFDGRALRQELARHEPRFVAVAYQDLASGRSFFHRADELVHAASTMKLPVMIEAFRWADGAGDLDRPMRVVNRFESIVDGAPFELSPEEDADPGLFAFVGEERPTRELVRRMIDASSNLATNLLIEQLGAAKVQATARELGARDMIVLRGVQDIAAYRKGLSNRTTARDLLALLRAIYEQRAASPQACAEMLEILLGQRHDDLIPAGLPTSSRVAHKTGRITRIQHDAGIVYPFAAPAYVLVVLTRGWDDPMESAAVIAEVARLVHAEHVRAGR